MTAPVAPARPRRFPLAEACLLLFTVAVGGGFAWAGAQVGLKGFVAGVGALGVAVCLVVVRDRMNLLLLGLTLSMVVLLHKSVGPSWDTISSGPISVYVTTFDLVLVLLYALWFLEGTMARDLAAALQRPVVWAPLFGAILTSVSVLVAEVPLLGVAEVVRMAAAYALFLLVAARVRRRSEIWTLLIGLAVLAAIQLVVVVLQWRTGGVLGLSFLGVPTELGERTLDGGQLGRPFGTIIHPVFLGAVIGSIAVFAVGMALFLRHPLQRLAALAVTPICIGPLLISHIRAASAAFVLAAAALVAAALLSGRVRVRNLVPVAGAALLFALPLTPVFVDQFQNNFMTDHFWLEVESRHELNVVGVEMSREHPVLGVGLNNFEQRMAPYQRHGLIFADHPVHNLFLLQAAESGLLGLLGLGIVGTGLAWVAVRTARRHPDPLCSAVAFGFTGVLVFFLLEEQLGFSLRHDVPRNLFWLLAGLMVACSDVSVDRDSARGSGATLARLGRWLQSDGHQAHAGTPADVAAGLRRSGRWTS